MTSVRGKTVIVTGGARGIGFEYCRQLILSGTRAVAILDLTCSDGEASARRLNEEFGKECAFFFPSDVTKFDEFEGVFEKATTALGGLDILVNNAGILNDKNWHKTIEINFMAVVNSTIVCYNYMSKQNGGKGGIIVNMSSVAGLLPFRTAPVYSATKHAVLGFTRSLAESWEYTGVSVRTICPGLTSTPLIAVNNDHQLDFIDKDKDLANRKTLPIQSVEYVGKALIEAIEKGENGSVWVSQACDPPFAIELAKYESIKFNISH